MKIKNPIGTGSEMGPEDKLKTKVTNGQYIMYFIYLCLLIFLSIYQITQMVKKDNDYVMINNSNDLRELLTKPLEGVWKYSVKWDKYNNTKDEYMSYGTAIFIWDYSKHSYSVHIAYSIQKIDTEESSIVTAFLLGTLEANNKGYATGKEILFDYKGRTRNCTEEGVNLGLSPHPIKMYNIDCTMNKNDVYQINAKYKSKKSEGTVTFTR